MATEPAKTDVFDNKIAGKIHENLKKAGFNPMSLDGDALHGDVTTWIPTGIVPLDAMLGGGLPAGRITEIYGPEGVYKTGLALLTADMAIQQGGASILEDNEYAFDKEKTRYCNEQNDAFVYQVAECLENSYEMKFQTLDAVASVKGSLATYIWDSLPATKPKAALEAKVGEKNMSGAVAAAMHEQQIPTLFKKTKAATCAMIVINQIRDNMNAGMFDPEFTTPGGHALRFYASIRVEMSRKGKFKWAETNLSPDGFKVKAYTIKNKCSAPLRDVDLTILFKDKHGVDAALAMYDWAFARKLTDATSGRYSLKGLNDDAEGKRLESVFFKDWQSYYAKNIEKIIAWFEERNEWGFKYTADQKKHIVAYTKAKYGNLLKA